VNDSVELKAYVALALVPGIGPHLADAVLATLRPGHDRAESNRAESSGRTTS